jgi:hypothetical protein
MVKLELDPPETFLDSITAPLGDSINNDSEDMAKIQRITAEVRATQDFKARAEKLEEASHFISNIANKGKKHISEETYTQLKVSARLSKNFAAYFRGMAELIKAGNLQIEGESIKQLAFFEAGFRFLSEGVDDYWKILDLKRRNVIRNIVEEIVKSIPNLKDYKYQKDGGEELDNHIEAIEKSAEFLLWKVQKLDKDNEKSTLTWDEEESFIDLLIETVKASENPDYTSDEIEAFERVMERLKTE